MSFINLVTDKPNWEDKVYDDQTLVAWLEEAKLMDRDLDLDGDVYFSEHMYKVVSGFNVVLVCALGKKHRLIRRSSASTSSKKRQSC